MMWRAAAFGRLCVETIAAAADGDKALAAAFGRLCVETSATAKPMGLDAQPPSGGCVLKRRP